MQHRQSSEASEVCSGVWAWQLHVIIQNIVHSLTLRFSIPLPSALLSKYLCLSEYGFDIHCY